jgi:ABC-type uncharacterized transport system involved in gliding motility auxiliary subunit
MSNEAQPGPRKAPAGLVAFIAALLGAIVFVYLNIVSAQVSRDARIDLTEQRPYSLSEGTRTLLAELKEPVREAVTRRNGVGRSAKILQISYGFGRKS